MLSLARRAYINDHSFKFGWFRFDASSNSNNGKNTDMQIWLHRGNPVDLTDKNSDDFRLKNIKYARSIDSTGKPSSIKPHNDVIPEHKIIPVSYHHLTLHTTPYVSIERLYIS